VVVGYVSRPLILEPGRQTAADHFDRTFFVLDLVGGAFSP
jgi:hypothetical protein